MIELLNIIPWRNEHPVELDGVNISGSRLTKLRWNFLEVAVSRYVKKMYRLLLGPSNSGRSRRNNNVLRHNRRRRLYASPPAVQGAISGPPGSRGMLRVDTGERRATGYSALTRVVGFETASEEELLRLPNQYIDLTFSS